MSRGGGGGGGGGGGSRGRRNGLLGCSVAHSDEGKRERVTRRNADDGVGEKGASEPPNGALMLEGRIIDAERVVRCPLRCMRERFEVDERVEADGGSTLNPWTRRRGGVLG